MSSFNYPDSPMPHTAEQLQQYARDFYKLNAPLVPDGRVPLGCRHVLIERPGTLPHVVARDVLMSALERYEIGQPFAWKAPRVWPKVLEDMTDAQLADLCATLRQPFDLARAKAGHPLVTRDGRKARFVAHVPEVDARTRVLAVIDDAPAVAGFYEGGNIYADGREHSMDLFLAPAPRVVNVNIGYATGGPVAPKRTVWVNTFKNPTPGGVVSMAFATKDAADSHGYNARSPFASVAVEKQQ